MSSTLAIDGGAPVRREPFAPWPWFEEDEIRAATEVLKKGAVNYWTGKEGREFENEFAAYVGVPHAVALANGTLALELALEAAGIGAGDEVVVTPRSFIASVSAVIRRGAIPVFADVDRDSQNVSAETIEAVLTPRSRAVLAVHLAGWPCDMDDILKLASDRSLVVLEDCAQAHGARYRGRPVGSMGHLSAFSFCQDKILTTAGEGGMVTTSSPELWRLIWSLKDHGKSWEAVYERQHPPGFRWLHESFGTNARLTEFQSAQGRVALRKLPEWVEKRRRNAAMLREAFSSEPELRVPTPPESVFHSYYKFYCFTEPEALRSGWDRDRILRSVMAEGIPCFSGSCSEIYLEKAFPADLKPSQRLPVARELGETSLLFLVHPTLSEGELQQTVEAVQKVLRVARR